MKPTDLEKRFADCCAATALELLIEREEDHQAVARGTLYQPFALIGRDPVCDIHLNDPMVSMKHAILQVVSGSVFVVDLGTIKGTHWPSGRQSHGWLIPGEPLQIGPFRLFLTRSAAANPTVLSPDFNPLTTSESGGCPTVRLEFLNGRRDCTSWDVNRVLTLLGRAPECKLNLAGDEIAPFHAYFLKTIAGLWVVDCLSRPGTLVNDQRTRFALLNEGDTLKFGRFSIGVSYPKPQPRSVPEDSSISFDVPAKDDRHPSISSARIGKPSEESMLALEEEFALLTPAPIAPSTLIVAGESDAAVVPMLRQMMDMQNVMFAQFQQSLLMMMQVFGQQMGNVQSEMARMTELTGELQKLQSDLLRPALPPKLPDAPVTEETAARHEAMWQRMEKLNSERQTLWQRLMGKVANK